MAHTDALYALLTTFLQYFRHRILSLTLVPLEQSRWQPLRRRCGGAASRQARGEHLTPSQPENHACGRRCVETAIMLQCGIMRKCAFGCCGGALCEGVPQPVGSAAGAAAGADSPSTGTLPLPSQVAACRSR